MADVTTTERKVWSDRPGPGSRRIEVDWQLPGLRRGRKVYVGGGEPWLLIEPHVHPSPHQLLCIAGSAHLTVADPDGARLVVLGPGELVEVGGGVAHQSVLMPGGILSALVPATSWLGVEGTAEPVEPSLLEPPARVLLYGDVPAEAHGLPFEELAARYDVPIVDARALIHDRLGPVVDAAERIAELVADRLGDHDGLVVDGLLLDLELGHQLRTAGVTKVAGAWLALAVPGGLPTFGIRCTLAGGCGAGVLWRTGDPGAPVLPAAADVPALASGSVPVERRLVLRHAGWLDGTAVAALRVVAGDPLHRSLAETAALARGFLAAALDGLRPAEAIAVVRRTIDLASALAGVSAEGRRRVAWQGTGW